MANEPCSPHCPAGDCAGCTFPPQRPCAGGWCRVRENCARYTQAYRHEPIERICKAGITDRYVPIQVVFSAGEFA